MSEWLSNNEIIHLKRLPNEYSQYYGYHQPTISTRNGVILYKGAWWNQRGEGYYNFYNIKTKQYFKIPNTSASDVDYLSGAFFNNSNKLAFSYLSFDNSINKSIIYEYNDDFTNFKELYRIESMKPHAFGTFIDKDDKTILIHNGYEGQFTRYNVGDSEHLQKDMFITSYSHDNLSLVMDDKYIYFPFNFGNKGLYVIDKNTLNIIMRYTKLTNLIGCIGDTLTNSNTNSIFLKNSKLYISSMTNGQITDMNIIEINKTENSVQLSDPLVVSNVAILCEYKNKFIAVRSDGGSYQCGVFDDKSNTINNELLSNISQPILTNYSNGVWDNKLYVLNNFYQYSSYNIDDFSLFLKNEIKNPTIIINKSMIDKNIYVNDNTVDTLHDNDSIYKINLNDRGYGLNNKDNLFSYSQLYKYYNELDNTFTFNLIRNKISLSHSINNGNFIEILVNQTSSENIPIRYRIKEDDKEYSSWSMYFTSDKIILDDLSEGCNKISIEVEDKYSSLKGYESNKVEYIINDVNYGIYILDKNNIKHNLDYIVLSEDNKSKIYFTIVNNKPGSYYSNIKLSVEYDNSIFNEIRILSNITSLNYGDRKELIIYVDKVAGKKSGNFSLIIKRGDVT